MLKMFFHGKSADAKDYGDLRIRLLPLVVFETIQCIRVGSVPAVRSTFDPSRPAADLDRFRHRN